MSFKSPQNFILDLFRFLAIPYSCTAITATIKLTQNKETTKQESLQKTREKLMKLITCNKFHPQDAASVFAFSEEGDILFLMWKQIHQSVQIVTLFTYSLVYLQG